MALLPPQERQLALFLIDISLVFPELFPPSHESCRRLPEKWQKGGRFLAAVGPTGQIKRSGTGAA
jgi:hypothetical protein